jgi:hypothetical protein
VTAQASDPEILEATWPRTSSSAATAPETNSATTTPTSSNDFLGKVWAVYSILDSGADQCMFPGFVMALLGLNVQNARFSMFEGAGPVNQVSLFFDNYRHNRVFGCIESMRVRAAWSKQVFQSLQG